MPKLPAPVWAAICAVVVYLPTLWNGYCRDDDALLNAPTPIVQVEFGTLATSHYWAGVEDDGNLYRPLTTCSLAVEELFAPKSPAAHHFVNLVLHAGAAVLGTLLLAAIGVEGAWLLLAGLWLAVHPVRADAVCEAVQRSELLAFLGIAGVLLCEVRRRRAQTGAAKWLVAMGAVLFAALLAKESAITVVALLPVFVWLCGDRLGDGGLRASVPAIGVTAAIAACYLGLRFAVLGQFGTGFEVHAIDNPYASLGFVGRLPGACAAAGTYAELVAVPWRLAADYSFAVFDPDAGWGVRAVVGLAVMAATGVALLPGAKKPWRVFGAAWIVLTLGPFANLLFPMGYVAAERALYIPLFGAALWLAAAGTAYTASRPQHATRLLGVAAAIVVLCGVRTLVRTFDWRSQARLFEANVRAQPRASRGWLVLAVERRNAGDVAGARAHYAQAVHLNPRYPEALRGLGDLERDAGAVEGAVRWYRQAVNVSHPDDPRQHGTLGAFLASHKRFEEAIPLLEEAAQRAPHVPAVWHNLVQALALMGNPGRAIETADRGIALHPHDSRLLEMRKHVQMRAASSGALTPPPERR